MIRDLEERERGVRLTKSAVLSFLRTHRDLIKPKYAGSLFTIRCSYPEYLRRLLTS
ncbi:hypothetical protein KEJ19_01335 [Candidatus Bathyarchaeota archaeon]|nr:hypothetical protein [Candidatus Bathyarchaeota archaeon]